MTDLTIVTNACSVTFSDPMLFLAWARVLAGQLPVEAYMMLFKIINPGNVDAVANAQHIVDLCMGAGA